MPPSGGSPLAGTTPRIAVYVYVYLQNSWEWNTEKGSPSSRHSEAPGSIAPTQPGTGGVWQSDPESYPPAGETRAGGTW